MAKFQILILVAVGVAEFLSVADGKKVAPKRIDPSTSPGSTIDTKLAKPLFTFTCKYLKCSCGNKIGVRSQTIPGSKKQMTPEVLLHCESQDELTCSCLEMPSESKADSAILPQLDLPEEKEDNTEVEWKKKTQEKEKTKDKGKKKAKGRRMEESSSDDSDESPELSRRPSKWGQGFRRSDYQDRDWDRDDFSRERNWRPASERGWRPAPPS